MALQNAELAALHGRRSHDHATRAVAVLRSLVATGASSMSWEYRYTLNVVVEDFSGDQNLLMAPVLLWFRENQPDAINNPELREKLLTFEVDILRNDVCDISLNLQLTERVLVSTDGGISTVEAEPEPNEPEEMWTVKRG